MQFRLTFAPVCLIAVTAAKLIPRNDFGLENLLLNRLADNKLIDRPEKNPNWMRGFYDEYDHHADSRYRQLHDRSYEPEYEHAAGDFIDYPLSSAEYEAYERSHGERGIGQHYEYAEPYGDYRHYREHEDGHYYHDE